MLINLKKVELESVLYFVKLSTYKTLSGMSNLIDEVANVIDINKWRWMGISAVLLGDLYLYHNDMTPLLDVCSQNPTPLLGRRGSYQGSDCFSPTVRELSEDISKQYKLGMFILLGTLAAPNLLRLVSRQITRLNSLFAF